MNTFAGPWVTFKEYYVFYTKLENQRKAAALDVNATHRYIICNGTAQSLRHRQLCLDSVEVGKKSSCSKISTELERRKSNINVHSTLGGIFALRTSKPIALSFASMATLSYPMS